MAAPSLQLIGSKKRLERENGINKLKELYDTMTSDENQRLCDTLKEWITPSPDCPWEKRHGGIMAIAVLVEKKKASDSFIDHIKNVIPGLLEDNESRVRIETGYMTICTCTCT